MKRLDCETTSTNLRVPPCGGAQIDEVTAELTRENHVTVPLTLTDDGDTYRVAIADPLPTGVPFPKRGVWTLAVTTPCGCYTAQVYVDCPAPQFVPVHTATAQAGPSQECCEPDDGIQVDIINLATPEIEVEGFETASLLINDAAAYAIRLGVAQTGNYRWLDADGVELAAGAWTAFGTTQYHDIDLTCATYFLAPPLPPEE